jgi:hypothetical protein
MRRALDWPKTPRYLGRFNDPELSWQRQFCPDCIIATPGYELLRPDMIFRERHAITGAYIMAGELLKAGGRHEEAFHNYQALLRDYISAKQRGAERFSSAFAPKTRWGLFLRNQVIKACAIPGLSKLAFGTDIIDRLQLPDYHAKQRRRGW